MKRKSVYIFLFFIFFNLTSLSKADMATSPCVKVYNELVKNFETIHPDKIDALGGKEYQFDVDHVWNKKEEKNTIFFSRYLYIDETDKMVIIDFIFLYFIMMFTFSCNLG